MPEDQQRNSQTTEPYIPPWDVCSIGYDERRKLSALELFVYHYEPTGEDISEEWRALLRDVLQERENQRG